MGLVTLKGYATLFLFAHFLIVTLFSMQNPHSKQAKLAV